MTAARRAYIDKYNTRLVTTEISSIDTLLTNAALTKGEELLSLRLCRRSDTRASILSTSSLEDEPSTTKVIWNRSDIR